MLNEVRNLYRLYPCPSGQSVFATCPLLRSGNKALEDDKMVVL